MGHVAAALDDAGASKDDRLMSIDAAGYRYATGRPGVVLVNDPLDTIHDVARAYGVRWLVLQRNEGVPAIAPILDGDVPDWLAPPIVLDPRSGEGDGKVNLGLYRVLGS
jgi:hypothetical protein